MRKLFFLLIVSQSFVLKAQYSYTPGVSCYSSAEMSVLKDSVRSLTQQIGTNPLVARLYGKRGYYKSPGGDYAGALLDYDTAIMLDKNYKNAYYSRGLMELHFNKCEMALSDFLKTLGFDSTDCGAISGLAEAYYCMDSGSLFLKYYTKAMLCSPGDCWYIARVVGYYVKNKDYAAALDLVDKAFFKGCGEPELLSLMGYIYKHEEDYNMAIAAYTQAIGKEGAINEQYKKPEVYSEMFFSRGYCYDELKMNGKALDDYTHALQLDKADKNSLFNRGLLYLKAHKRKLAGKDFYAAALLGDEDAISYLHDEFHELYVKYSEQKTQ